MSICPYCHQEQEASKAANHIRWCLQNPKRQVYLDILSGTRQKQEYSEDRKMRMVLGIKKAWASGKYQESVQRKKGKIPHPQSREARDKISAAQRKLTKRRLMRYTREYRCKNGEIVLLDSSWEEELAKRLDDLQIDWVRPNYIIWVDKENKERKYFPDFYLPKYNIYLDPKNPAVEKAQKEKLDIVTKLLPNLVILHSLKECKEYSPAPAPAS